MLGETLPLIARDMLSSPPARGEGKLNKWYFRTALVLHAFRTSAEIIELLYAATDGESRRRNEIERAVKNSKKVTGEPGQPASLARRAAPAWPEVDQEKRAKAILESGDTWCPATRPEGIIKEGAGLLDLWEQSPVRLDDDKSHTEEIIDALFPGNPLLCAGRSNSKFATREREEWRGKLAALTVIVPSPMTSRLGWTQEGKLSAHTKSNTGQRRFLVIEQDYPLVDDRLVYDQGVWDKRFDDQAAVLLHLSAVAPLALAVHSAGKSLHGWFYCAGQSEEKLHAFMRYAVSIGADPALWVPSQFTRMPDGRHAAGKRQTVFYFDPEALNAERA